MSSSIFDIPENCLQFMHQMSIFDLEQKQRYGDIKVTLNQLKECADLFMKYVKLVLKPFQFEVRFNLHSKK
jgi:hypothetical protein